jgi:hypothetical protein
MNAERRTKLAATTLLTLADYCDNVEEIQDIIDEMSVIHFQVMKEQHDLLGGQL